MSFHSKACAVPGASAHNRPLEGCTCGQAARAQAYAEAKARVDAAASAPDAQAEAARLVADGWEQASRKYRMVRRGRKERTLDEGTFEAFRRLVKANDKAKWALLGAMPKP